MNEKKYIDIKSLKRPVLKKCEMCDKVQEVYYKALIYDAETAGFIVGELSLCKQCGRNLHEIINKGNEDVEELGEVVLQEFTFDDEG